MTTTVILALSPRAAQALEGFIMSGHRPPVIDEILAELSNQLTEANERDGAATAWRTPVAQRVAEQMAAAGADALRTGKDST